MWYPLKKSVYSLSLASAVLMMVVLFGQPLDSPANASPEPVKASHIDAAAITFGATSLADRLPLENATQREAARAALGVASLVLIAKLQQQQEQIALDAAAIEAQANAELHEATAVSRAGRSGTAMPFFSFARWVHPGQERGS
jgi:hypothetical protein